MNDLVGKYRAVRLVIWSAKDCMTVLFGGNPLEFEDEEIRDIYYKLNDLSIMLSNKIEGECHEELS